MTVKPKTTSGSGELGTETRQLLDELASQAVLYDGSSEATQEIARLGGELLTIMDKDPAAASLQTVRSALRELRAPSDMKTAVEHLAAQLSQVDVALAERSLNEPGPESTLEFLSALPVVIDEIETDLLDLEKNRPDALRSLRARIHSVKGDAGALHLDAIVRVIHGMEDVLERPIPVKQRVTELLSAIEWLRGAPEVYADGQEPDSLKQTPASSSTSRTTAEPPAEDTDDSEPADRADEPAPEGFQRDEETLALIGEFLQESYDGLGKVDQLLMNAEQDGLTADMINSMFRVFHTIKGVAGFLGLEAIATLAHATESLLNQVRQGALELSGAALDAVFEATAAMRALLDDVRLAVESGANLTARSGVKELIQRIDRIKQGEPVAAASPSQVAPGTKLGEILVQTANIPKAEVEAALKASERSGRRIGEELVSRGVVEPRQVADALRAQAASERAGRLKETIKVDVDRIDSLVEMIGELVIVQSMVANLPEVLGIHSQQAQNSLALLTKITRDLQGLGMRMRMVPVRTVFQKMARVVRDLAHKSGKQVRLVTHGESAEMDRSMVEQIADPLVHMIRNSVDHGLESADDRVRAGKTPQGTIKLSASHQGSNIVIEVSDDGRGLNRDRILAKARSQGLIGERQILSESEIHELIFQPGFSTAAQVTEISGRGVGMDVVKRNIECMRGRIHIQSTEGVGTTFRFVLPITLAAIDGMLVACGEERYILPTLSIVESIQPRASMLKTYAGRGEMILVRGEIIPLLRLDRLFGIDGARQDPTEGLVVVVDTLGSKVGLLVDTVITQQHVVIKSLGSGIKSTRYLSGAAILANGRVGLILNIEEIGRMFEEHKGRHLGPADLTTSGESSAA